MNGFQKICAYLRCNLRQSAGNDACTANNFKGQKGSRRFSQIFPQISADILGFFFKPTFNSQPSFKL
jgi:hypothetical protein